MAVRGHGSPPSRSRGSDEACAFCEATERRRGRCNLRPHGGRGPLRRGSSAPATAVRGAREDEVAVHARRRRARRRSVAAAASLVRRRAQVAAAFAGSSFADLVTQARSS